MSHTVNVAYRHKARKIIAFLPISFGLGVSMCGRQASPTHLTNMVAWQERRRSLVLKSCLISMPAHLMRRWRACA